MNAFDPWALVLAAGEGSRLRDLTTDRLGHTIPKQFCSLNGGPSLLQLALQRAARTIPWYRIVTIVAAEHESWWHDALIFMPERNIVVQPRNRGTGIGVTLPLLRILSRDPEARIVLLPSDHYVADEDVLERAVREALAEVGRRPQRIVLLGIVPDDSDGDFGWVVPADPGEPGIQRVAEFVEKPPAQAAAELIARGALWNSFILVAEAKTLLELFDDRLPGVVTSLWGALARSPRPESAGDPLAEVYERLDAVDFSREVLENCVERLSVLPVPPCGWCDLGTPVRVARCVDRLAPDAPETPRIPAASDVFDLGQASRLRGYVTGAGLPTPTPDAKTPPRQRRDGVFERNL